MAEGQRWVGVAQGSDANRVEAGVVQVSNGSWPSASTTDRSVSQSVCASSTARNARRWGLLRRVPGQA